ncbi:MAG TPA: TonB-dependent receptor, partial [Candidatus Sulfotelmatobacter sp.]|nr:TonB-dependent receptor [Candidatus Sulfotelmatobacter sp.]
ITNHFEHLQMNWIIKPNLFNHTTLSYDRWVMLGHQLSGGVGWNQKLGLGLPDEPIFNNAGFPQLNFVGGNQGYTHFGTPWASQGADINNRYQFLDDVTWVTGKHTLKAGMEFRYMTFPQTGWAVNTGGNFDFHAASTAGFDSTGTLNSNHTGNELASFLLGQADHANFTVPIKYMPKMKYGAIWVNDDFKVLHNLTLTIGLRFDYQGNLYEEFGRFSTFDPNAPNPVGVPGATVFHTSKANGNTSWNVGPRFGFAYALNPKTVIRGGYGMYYAGVQADSWDPYPVDGYQTNPTINNSNGRVAPTFYMAGPGATATSTGCAQEALVAAATGFAIPCNLPSSQITFPPDLRADVSNGANPVGVDPRTYTMPRYQNWSISFQRQLSQNTAIDLAYVGNHGTRLIDGRSSAGVYDNMNPGSVIDTYGPTTLLETFTNGVCDHNLTCGNVPAPYAGFSGTVAQALRTWPQYQQINWRFFPFGNSRYNALQVAFNQRMKAGLDIKVAYTYSRLMNNGSETGLGSGGPPVQNPSDMRDLYTVSSDDVPHIFSLGWIYKLPFGKGKSFLNHAGAVDKIVGGWQISGVQSYSSGRPLSITTNNGQLGAVLFNYTHYPNKSGGGKTSKNGVNGPYLSTSGWSDPGAYGFGNAPRQDSSVRGFHYFNEDISIFKDTYFTEERYIRFEADAGNAFNRSFYCPVNTDWSNVGAFGTTSSQCNIPRRIQFGLQLFF